MGRKERRVGDLGLWCEERKVEWRKMKRGNDVKRREIADEARDLLWLLIRMDDKDRVTEWQPREGTERKVETHSHTTKMKR
ncbi:hypothetical protein Pmani_004764 [Petrolisthes manimaculis]|uniref:Uncharacterized protein n=1 Tax=Petrolisthes manimaculis TaxID=1843537 RepID=A0AAE1UI65_9EUCA|nr:hypothetical protein Pmani_004764 [Petrolisthes manimaculis]